MLSRFGQIVELPIMRPANCIILIGCLSGIFIFCHLSISFISTHCDFSLVCIVCIFMSTFYRIRQDLDSRIPVAAAGTCIDGRNSIGRSRFAATRLDGPIRVFAKNGRNRFSTGRRKNRLPNTVHA